MDTRLRGYDKLNQGFTLVELSIVLLVIGLLVGGVLVGRDMIRAAELRSITTQKDQLQSSVMLFQDKYHGLPGDLKNATAFWGEMGAINGGTGVCSNTAAGASGATGTQTCNGDGDGKIIRSGVPDSNMEILLFWQHLSNAGLIGGKYSGVWGGTYGIEGQEMSGKINNTSWQTSYRGVVAKEDLGLFEGDYEHVLNMYYSTGGPFLTTAEAWAIDKKIDDGLPGLGELVSVENDNADCNTLDRSVLPIATDVSYNFDNKEPACRQIFKNMW